MSSRWFTISSFRDFYSSLSIITLLLFTSSILIFGTNLFYQNFESNNQSIPSEIEAGQINEQLFAIGRGQKFSLEVRSNKTLRITVFLVEALHVANESDFSNYILYNHQGDSFNIEIACEDYTLICIYWNNSVLNNETSPTRIISGQISITGLDMDLVIISGIFIILGVFYEAITRIIGSVLKEISVNGVRYKQISHSSQNNEILELKRKKASISLWTTTSILLKREYSIFPVFIVFSVLIISFIVSNATQKFILLVPSSENLSLALITEWISKFQIFSFIWTCIIILIGLGVWHSKNEKNELLSEFSLPIGRKTYVMVILLVNSLSCTIALLVPYCIAILINLIRFSQVPSFSIIGIFLLWIIMWEIILLLISGTIFLLLPHSSFYSNFILIGTIIIISQGIIEIIKFDMLLGPFPLLLDSLITAINSTEWEINEFYPLIGGSSILLFMILLLYLKAASRFHIA